MEVKKISLNLAADLGPVLVDLLVINSLHKYYVGSLNLLFGRLNSTDTKSFIWDQPCDPRLSPSDDSLLQFGGFPLEAHVEDGPPQVGRVDPPNNLINYN